MNGASMGGWLRATGLLLHRSRSSIVPSQIPATVRRPTPRAYKHRAWHPEKRPKAAYVIRVPIKDAYTDALQHVENRGMYHEELDLERSRHPKMVKSLHIRSDGALDEVECEYAAPPVVILFSDRLESHKAQMVIQQQLGQEGGGKKESVYRSWIDAVKPTGGAAGDAAETSGDSDDDTQSKFFNVLEFPFATMQPVTPRPVMNINADHQTRPVWTELNEDAIEAFNRCNVEGDDADEEDDAAAATEGDAAGETTA